MSLRIEEIYHNNFNANRHTIHDEIFPTHIGHTDRIHKGCEEIGCTPEELFDGDTARAIEVGEEFYEVG